MKNNRIEFCLSLMAGILFILLAPSTFATDEVIQQAEDAAPTLIEIAAATSTETKSTTSTASETEQRTWNLKNVDIRTVVLQVSKETGKNFIIDPRVKGNVTIMSGKPLSPDQVYQVFLSMLQVHGYAAIPNGDIIKIIPAKQATKEGIPLSLYRKRNNSDELIVKIIHINYVPTRPLLSALKPLVPKESYIASYEPTNDLIIADDANNVQRISDIVENLDRPADDETEFVQLKYAAAAEVVNILTALEGRSKSVRDRLKFASDERTNSILLSGGKSRRLHIRALVKQLDTPGKSSGHTQVIYLKYTQAQNIAPIVANIVDNYYRPQTKAAGTGNQQNGSASSQGLSRNFPTDNRIGVRGSNQSTRTFQGFLFAQSLERGQKSGTAGSSVQWEETTNSIIIKAPPELMRIVKSVIAKLDIRRPQVLVEAIIAEVNVNRLRDLGFEWNTGGSVRLATRFPTVIPGTTSITKSILGDAAADIAADSSTIIGRGLSLGFFHGGKLRALLRALSTDNVGNILSTPNVVTLDNEIANIKVGRLVPFAIGSSTNNLDSGGNPFTSFTREEVGLSLTLRPRITHSGTIKLEIETILSSVIPGTGGTGASENPTTSERAISTNVMVDDGQILVLGGLMQKDWTDTVSKVPVLGDIPLIGHTFRSRTKTLEKSNLMIFLRPMILRTANHGSDISADKYSFIRQTQLDTERDLNRPFVDDVTAPAITPEKNLPPPFPVRMAAADMAAAYNKHASPVESVK